LPFLKILGGSESQTNNVINICGRRFGHSTATLSKRWPFVAVLSIKQFKPNDDPSKEFADAKRITDELLAVVQLR
jgi:hypothetical protein